MGDAAAAAAPAAPRKKVLVTGCFDLMHNGHVQFFQEASAYGDLYVRVGSDANIELLKHHRPMYSQEERVFMVRALKCVHDVGVSAGTGMFDFETDMELIKPDVYFVNEDASQLEARRPIAAKFGIEMVVKPREAPSGLGARSSTDMKARLREEQKQAAAADLADIGAFHEVFPWRLCFAGGWLDLKWCNEFVPSSTVITINIKFNRAICRDRCGLATSSRKHAIKAWNGRVPDHLEAAVAAHYLWGIENTDHFSCGSKPYIAGSQDQCGLFFPGVNALVYRGGAGGTNWPTHRINLNDPSDPAQAAVFAWLEEVLHIVDIPFVSRPPDYDSQRVNHLKDPNVAHGDKAAMVQALADASDRAWKAILAKDAPALGQALSATMKAWGQALPYTVDPYRASPGYAGDPVKSAELRDFCKQYEAPHSEGCLFSGAGGGFLMVISDKPVAGAFKVQINHDPICKPFPSDSLDSEPQVLLCRD